MSIQKVKIRVQTATHQKRVQYRNNNNNPLKFDLMNPSKSVNLQTNRVLFSRPTNFKSNLYETTKQLYQSQRLRISQNNSKATSTSGNGLNLTSRFRNRANTASRSIRNSYQVSLNQMGSVDFQDLVISNVFKKDSNKEDRYNDFQSNLIDAEFQDVCKIKMKELNFDKAKTSHKRTGNVFSYGVNSYKKGVSFFDEKEVRICVINNLYKTVGNYSQAINSSQGTKQDQLTFFAIYQTKQKGPYIEYIRQRFHKLLMQNKAFEEILKQQENLKCDIHKLEKKLGAIITSNTNKIQQLFLENLGNKKLKQTFLLDGDFNFSIAIVSKNNIFMFKKGNTKVLCSFDFGEQTYRKTKFLNASQQQSVVEQINDNDLTNSKILQSSDAKANQTDTRPSSDRYRTQIPLKQHPASILLKASKDQRIIRLSQSKYNSMRKNQIFAEINKHLPLKNYNRDSKKEIQVKVIPVNDQTNSPDFLILGGQGLSICKLSDKQIKNIIWRHMLNRNCQLSSINNKKRFEGLNLISGLSNQNTSGIVTQSLILNSNNAVMNGIANHISLIHDWTGQAVDKLILEALSTDKINSISAILITFKKIAQIIQNQQSTSKLELPFVPQNR